MEFIGFTYRLAATLVLMAVIVVLSVIPGDPQPGDSVFVWAIAEVPSLLQKSMHVVLYGLLTVLWGWTLVLVQPNTARRWSIVLAIVIGFGAALEVCQLFVPGRFGSTVDVGFDTIGAVVGMLVGRRLLQPVGAVP